MSHENYGFTGSSATIETKKPSVANNDKYYAKNCSNGAYVIDIKNPEKNPKGFDYDDYDPYLHRDVEHPTTFWETLLHMVKGSLGSGILAMPKAFVHAGWLLGSIGTLTIGLISTYCIRSLIISSYELCKRKKVPSMTYPTTMESALEEGPQCLRKFSKYCPLITNVFLLIYQLGICCVYTVFIGENLKMALDPYIGTFSLKTYMLWTLLPLILINYIRNLKLLAPVSSFANFITLISFGIIAYYIFREPITFEGKVPIGKVEEFPLFLGTVLFSLEAIGVIMPLENEMKKPRAFIKPAGVLNIGMGINVVLYIAMGFFGYMRYGTSVHGAVTLDLPGELPSKIAQLLLAISMYFSHALQCYVAIDLTWNEYIQPKFRYMTEKQQLIREYILRTLIVMFTFLLGYLIPQLDLFISLFGALCLAAVGISFPALIQICTFWKTNSTGGRIFLVTKSTAIILFGLLALVVGTYTSLSGIIETFGKSDNLNATLISLVNNTGTTTSGALLSSTQTPMGMP